MYEGRWCRGGVVLIMADGGVWGFLLLFLFHLCSECICHAGILSPNIENANTKIREWWGGKKTIPSD